MADSKYKLQPAIKKETLRVTLYSVIGLAVMFAAFAVFHFFVDKDSKLFPLNYTVFLGGGVGALIAVLNFFLMCVTVQEVTKQDDAAEARKIMKTSYTKRMGLQLLWMVVAIAAPCFHWAAGLLPLLFPTLGIKIKGIIDSKRYTPNTNEQEVESKQDEHRD